MKISESLLALASDDNVVQLDIIRLVKERKLTEEQIRDIYETALEYYKVKDDEET